MSVSESNERHWELVESSNINALCFDGPNEKLYVRFHHGGVYIYSDVPAQTYRDMMDAESKGRYFAQNVKGKFDAVKEE